MTNLILGIAGSIMLIVGIFLPIINSELGSFSYFSTWQASSQLSLGIFCAVVGLISLIIALVKKYRLLIVTGILAMGLVVVDFVVSKSKLDEYRAAGSDVNFNYIGWIVLLLGAILVLLAGVMKSNVPATGTNWGPTPPPPPPYTPGR